MTNKDEDYITISDEAQLNNLIEEIKGKSLFGRQLKFSDRALFLTLLESLDIDYTEFTKNYFYIDNRRNLHISESGNEYVWISTHGLIAKNKATTNRAVNSCVNQYTVISLLMDKAIEISQSKTVYDVDSYDFGYLCELSPALFHNILFYIEVFCKAYLSLNNVELKNTHKLSVIYNKTVETMNARKHNNSLFQVRILDPLFKFVDHVNSIPGNFKEQYVKYDDNPEDDTVIIFETERLQNLITIFELSQDFIIDYYYMGNKTYYLKSGLFQKLIEKAKTEEEKNRIRKVYSYLNEN
jgi:hypothetical protein